MNHVSKKFVLVALVGLASGMNGMQRPQQQQQVPQQPQQPQQVPQQLKSLLIPGVHMNVAPDVFADVDSATLQLGHLRAKQAMEEAILHARQGKEACDAGITAAADLADDAGADAVFPLVKGLGGSTRYIWNFVKGLAGRTKELEETVANHGGKLVDLEQRLITVEAARPVPQQQAPALDNDAMQALQSQVKTLQIGFGLLALTFVCVEGYRWFRQPAAKEGASLVAEEARLSQERDTKESAAADARIKKLQQQVGSASAA